MPISLQADSVLPVGYILVNGQKIAAVSTTQGLSADVIRANSFVGNAGSVGSVAAFPSTIAPTGWLKLNGAELLRNDFPLLWSFAETSGNIVTEAAWTNTGGPRGSFSTGDTSTTFRIPDLRGEFVRGWADNRSVDTGRTIGSFQNHQFQNHTHSVSWNNNSYFRAQAGAQATHAGIPFGNVDRFQGLAISVGDPNSGNRGDETRPRNISLLYCIKY